MKAATSSRSTSAARPAVLQGTMEIAGQMSAQTRGLRSVGISALSVNYQPTYLSYLNDVEIDLSAFVTESRTDTLRRVVKWISEHFDLFHFHFGSTLWPAGEDLPALHRMDRRIVMQHWGSDVRQLALARRDSPDIVVKNDNESDLKRHLEFLGSHISTAVLSDCDLAPHVSPYYERIRFVPQLVDVNEYPLRVKASRVGPVVIAHAPTHQEFKGTRYIREAVDEISRTYNVEFLQIEGVPHIQALQMYARADIVIDQLLAGAHGVLALECMAMGKPVICFLNERMREYYPPDIPIINADRHTLGNVLRLLLDNRDMLPHLGAVGRPYVERWHGLVAVIPRLISVYQEVVAPDSFPNVRLNAIPTVPGSDVAERPVGSVL